MNRSSASARERGSDRSKAEGGRGLVCESLVHAIPWRASSEILLCWGQLWGQLSKFQNGRVHEIKGLRCPIDSRYRYQRFDANARSISGLRFTRSSRARLGAHSPATPKQKTALRKRPLPSSLSGVFFMHSHNRPCYASAHDQPKSFTCYFSYYSSALCLGKECLLVDDG